MPKNKNTIKVEGLVEEALPSLLFRVVINTPEGEEKEILARLAGKMKLYRIRVVPGDKVIVEMPDINDRRGRIIRRL